MWELHNNLLRYIEFSVRHSQYTKAIMKYKTSSTNNKEYSHVQAGWTENISVRDKELSESGCPLVGVRRERARRINASGYCTHVQCMASTV